jgi:hypothetical protein
MTTNRLAERSAATGVTVEKLEDLAAEMNSQWWVKHWGRHYFVSREVLGGKVVHSLAWQQAAARMTQASTIACVWTSYVSKFVALGFFALAFGAAANGIDLWAQARGKGHG